MQIKSGGEIKLSESFVWNMQLDSSDKTVGAESRKRSFSFFFFSAHASPQTLHKDNFDLEKGESGKQVSCDCFQSVTLFFSSQHAVTVRNMEYMFSRDGDSSTSIWGFCASSTTVRGFVGRRDWSNQRRACLVSDRRFAVTSDILWQPYWRTCLSKNLTIPYVVISTLSSSNYILSFDEVVSCLDTAMTPTDWMSSSPVDAEMFFTAALCWRGGAARHSALPMEYL